MARHCAITVIGRGLSAGERTEQLQRTAGDQNVRKADPPRLRTFASRVCASLQHRHCNNGISRAIAAPRPFWAHGPIVLCGEAHDDA